MLIRHQASTLGTKHSHHHTTMSTSTPAPAPAPAHATLPPIEAYDEAFEAAASGNMEALKACDTMVLAGHPTQEIYPLQIAVINGHLPTVKVICNRLGKEVAVQCTGSDGATAVHLAAMYGRCRVMPQPLMATHHNMMPTCHLQHRIQ